jgi:hypothetical protein
MKNIVFAALAFLLVVCIEVHAQTLNKLWEVTGLEAPESVIYDSKNNLYYVSNVAGNPDEKNGNGYLSQVDENGKLVNQKWVTGLHAPKGMGIHNGKLYVADIDRVAIVNIADGTVEKMLPAEGATFLNDVAVAPNGDVYISDTFGGNAIYRLSNDKIDIWFKDEKLDYPNGLLVKGNDVLVSSWGAVTNPETFETAVKGKLLKVSMADKKVTDITKSFINGDGLVDYKNGYILSDWVAGKIYFVDNKGSYKEIGSYNAGTADLTLVKSKNVLLIPQMMEGKLMAFSLK